MRNRNWDGTGGEGRTVLEGGAGTWNATNLNWSLDGGATNTIYNPALQAIFGQTPTVGLGGTVILGQDLTFTGLEFRSNGYGIGGAFNLMPVGMATLNVNAGITAVIGSSITGTGGLNITGGGRMVLNGNNTYTGGTTLGNATLIVNSDTALGTGTLTINNAAAVLGASLSGETLTNAISLQSDVTITTGASGINFFLNGNIDLNGGTRIINASTASSQIQFGGVISNGSLTYATPFTAPGDYVAFILTPTNANTYTGLTTIGNGAFVVLQGSTTNGAIQGDGVGATNDVLITGNGVLDYLGTGGASPFASEQIADDATVTVDSNGNLANGERFTGLDLYQAGSANTETIGTLLGSGR